MPATAGIESDAEQRRARPAGLADPALFVPPINARSARRFGLAWLLTPLLLAAVLPLFTYAFVNRYDSGEAAFVEGLYVRKAVAMARAAERSAASNKPRLVIVGGSGALLGIDAELIELKLGIPTVNLATHAGLGGEYILDRARRELRPGDRVLLCPEYQLWNNPPAGAFNDLEWQYVCTYDKAFLTGLGRARMLKMLYSVAPGDYAKSVRGWLDRARGKHHHTRAGYNLAALGTHGDLRAALPKAPVGHNPGYPFPDVRTATRVNDFRRFADWARQNNVRVYHTWPNMVRPDAPIPAGADEAPAAMTALMNELGFILLDKPSDTVYPREWYTDTAYHADAGCRRLRTEALVRRLRPHVGLPPAPDEPAGFYLVASPTHRPTVANAFADEPGVRVKYLSAEPIDHPDAVTPQGIARLVQTGLPVYADEPGVKRQLAGAGWRFDEVGRSTASLPKWLRKYNRHVLLIARAGTTQPTPFDPAVPPLLSGALQSTAAVAAVIDTTPFNSVQQAVAGRQGQPAQLKTDLRSLAQRGVPQLAINIIAPATGSGAPEIRVNRMDWTRAVDGDVGNGVWVVVIDAEMGVVVDAATFPDATDAEAVVRRLDRVRR